MLAIQYHARRRVAATSIVILPNEIIMKIVESLVPTHDLLNPSYVGSRALRSAKTARRTLLRFCMVSKRMNALVIPYLYRDIIITDSNKLRRLHDILVEHPVKLAPILCSYIKSLAVHQKIVAPPSSGEQDMSLEDFSFKIISILEITPRLTKFSLVPIGTEVFQVSAPCPCPCPQTATRGDYGHKFQPF